MVRGDRIAPGTYFPWPWWLAICSMHFCLTCSSERPEFLPFSALIQAFIFGSCEDVAFEAELLLTLSFGV